MRSKKLFLFGALIISTLLWVACDSSNSIDLPDYFVKYYGEEGDQEGVDMIVNADGSFYLFGNSTLPGQNKQLYLVKVDEKGNMIWEKGKYFGGKNFTSQARDIEISSDGSKLILAATSMDNTGDTDVLLITLNSESGNKIDSIRYGYTGTEEDVTSVTQVTGGFIATGSTSNTSIKANQVLNDSRDVLCLRFNNDLTIYDPSVWLQTLGPGTFDAGVKTMEAGPGLFYFFGYSNRAHGSSFGNLDFVIYQMNNNGIPKGADIFSGSPLKDEQLTSVTKGTLDSGEGFLLSGISTDNAGNSMVFMSKVIKTLNSDISGANLNQNLQFETNFSFDVGKVSDKKTSSYPSMSSGFLVLSNENSQGKENFSLSKITSGGSPTAWANPNQLTFGGANEDLIGSVAELPDGKIVMIGTFTIGDDLQKKMALIKVNREGKFRD